MHIVTVCGMGFGTSLMMLMDIQSIAKKHGFVVGGEATDVGSAANVKADIYVTSNELKDKIATNTEVIAIKNMLDKQEIEDKVMPHISSFFSNK